MSSTQNDLIKASDILLQLQAGSSMPMELMEVFAEEAEDHLRTIYGGMDRLKKSNSDQDALGDVRRASHTLKGAAGAVGLQAVTNLAHRMEDLLDRLAESGESVSDVQLNLLFATADQLQELTSEDLDFEVVATQIATLYRGYDHEMGNADNAENGLEAVVDQPEEVSIGQEDRRENSRRKETRRRETRRREARSDEKKGQQFLRVPMERLDDLVRLLSEMIVNRTELQQQIDNFESRIGDMNSAFGRLNEIAHLATPKTSTPQNGTFAKFLGENQNASKQLGNRGLESFYGFDQLEFEQFDRHWLLEQRLAEADKDAEILGGELQKSKTAFAALIRRQQQLNRDAQRSMMKIRMVPLATISTQLDRTVRTVSKKLGKAIDFEILGAEIEIDKAVLDAIVDPLLHLLRNAMDHGIESVEQRRAAGKSEQALVRLKAINHGTQITLRISDDGAGIDLQKVSEKAVAQGLIDAAEQLSEAELLRLIFMPGFSTAKQLTDVSGRGVGMDVVGEAIERLKGTISVESDAGIGTTFTIQLPTTMGVSRATLVEASGSVFAVPMQSVSQIQKLDPKSVCLDGDTPRVRIDGKELALINLASHLGLKEESQSDFELAKLMIIVGKENDDQTAVIVDAIVGQQDIVVKSLGSHLKNIRGIIGATIGGDGSVIPILDVEFCLNSTKFEISNHQTRLRYSKKVHRNFAMVIDDSISVRRVTANLLQFAGWDVVMAKDGVDALEQLSELDRRPDVFLTDMEMPRMDGFELVRQIKEQEDFARTPIVMVTSRASEQHRHKAYEAGVNEYVVKPFDDEKLIKLITDLVNDSRAVDG